MIGSSYLIESVNYIKTSLMYVVLISTKSLFICNTCLQYETILSHDVTSGMMTEILLPIKFTKLISINDQLVSSFLVWNKVMYSMHFLLELSNAMILKRKQHKVIKSRLSTTFAHEFLVLKTLLYVIYVNWRSRRSFCKCVLKTVPIPLFSQAIFTSVFAVSDGRPFEPTQIKTFYELVFYIHIYA